MEVLQNSRATESNMRFVLGDRNRDVALALAAAFADLDCVEVVCGDLLDTSPDCVVCPGNSFGDMGGGFDKAVDDFHGGKAQPEVARAIAQHHLGELPVGAALVVEVPGATRARVLVMAPTMRVPGPVPELGVYLATRAALVALAKLAAAGSNKVRSVAIPGMGTGVGRMGFSEAAAQMRAAFASVVEGQWRRVVHPAMAPFALGSGGAKRRG